MFYSRFSLIAFLLCIPLIVNAQQEIKIKKSEFKLDKDGFNQAWNHVKEGDRYFELGGGLFPEAVNHYIEALKYNPGDAPLNYKLGVSYLMSKFPVKAIECFLQARELDPDISVDIILLTGKAYHLNGDFGKALDCFNMYSDKMIRSDDFDVGVNKLIRECNTAIEIMQNTTEVRLTNLGENINSAEDDYSPVVADNGRLIYFTSRRNFRESKERQRSDMKWDENIFVSTKGEGGWNMAGSAGKFLTTENNEGVLMMDENNGVMYIYAGWAGNGDIYLSEFKKGQWNEPYQTETGINSTSRETSYAISGSMDEIYFTSDSKKGIGGRDIYYISRIRKNKWTKPFNLGPDINSPGNEESVWVSATGDTLWFSSNGRDGMGGYDIYMAIRDEYGSWSGVKHLGTPVNSQWNDLFYRPSGYDNMIFYLASDRPDGFGGFDIYEANWNPRDSVGPYPPETFISLPDSVLVHKPDSVNYYR
ncbi:MAG TPA: tetratricopeptide repeat protein [Bacteroidales bacterium]|nr:tetratricopeptide repeat protein [Bacteroidales bacterium]